MKKEDLDALVSLYEGVYSPAESGEYLSEAPQIVPAAARLNQQTTKSKPGESAADARIRASAIEDSRRGSVIGQLGRTLTRGFGSNKDIARVDAEDKASQARINQRVAASQGKYYSSSDGKTYANYNDAVAARNSRLGANNKPAATTPAARPAATRPAATSPAARPATPGAGAKVSPSAAAKPAGQTGDKAKDMATWAKANPTLANKPKTPNPLMQKTFGYQTGNAPDQIKAASAGGDPAKAAASFARSKETANKLGLSGSVKALTSGYEWGSKATLKDVASLYSSIYEGKKKDQDQDGDTDFADVRIARMIASGMSRAEAIAAVKNKEYNEEYELDEATRMRKELGKEGEIATRKELAARSRAYKRSGSVDKTIAAAERGADRPYVKHKRGESDADRSKREGEQSRTLRGLAASRRGSVRGPDVNLRGYAAKVEGDDKELQSARGSARSAGTLTPAEKKKLGEEFYMWVEALIDEGYDLSEYTWDEMYHIYEETDKEREERLAARRARVREMESQGRVMTSSRRTSERAKQRKEEQQAERLEKLANKALADTVGTTRRSSKPMGSEAQASKGPAPEANRKIKGSVKRDTLASRADELLRMIQSEDFELWLEDLIEEGYELSEWTDDEIIDLYEEIIEEKYGTAAGRKRVAKMARSGKDIGKKGPGFQKMVDKLTPKYGKERATKIAAAQMYKTHA